MSAPVLQFRVVGLPVTQGNHRAVKPAGAKFARIIDSNQAQLRSWREAVRWTAVATAGQDWQPLTGPVRVLMLFALPKPTSAPKTRRTWPTGARSGDWEKLARAVGDALTDAAIWRDDSQVVDGRAVKDFPGTEIAMHVPGVTVAVWRVEGPMAPVTAQIPLLPQPIPGETL